MRISVAYALMQRKAGLLGFNVSFTFDAVPCFFVEIENNGVYNRLD